MDRSNPGFGLLEKLGRAQADELESPNVYLAGPDVFFPDVTERAARMKALLAERGMTGLFPLDSELDPTKFPDRKDLGLAIARANEALMRKADICLANVQPWRGVEADDGTSYEIGFMAALDKIIVLYTNDQRPFFERITNDVYGGDVYQDGPFQRGGSDHMMVEEFDRFADNLMLINAAAASAEQATGEKFDPATIVQFGFEAAADLAKRLWDAAYLARS
jgi:nucleoside 2-deoxyribosyltransferase